MSKSASSNVLKVIAEYCNNEPDLDTLNKICEVASLTGMKLKDKLDTYQTLIFDNALNCWTRGEPTPEGFKNTFRGAM